MAGWSAIADLAFGIFKRFFSKEAKEEGRTNEIEKLEREQKNLAIHNVDGRNDKRLTAIAARLQTLYQNS